MIPLLFGIGPQNTRASTAYDPTCGSGSLLLDVSAHVDTRVTLRAQDGIQHLNYWRGSAATMQTWSPFQAAIVR